MKRLLILGAGTAGTIIANRLRKKLPSDDWQIVIVDEEQTHYYQPGYLFLPFGGYEPDEITRPIAPTLADGIDLHHATVELVDTDTDEVVLSGGDRLGYDQLVIATGTSPQPSEIEGLAGPEWRRSIHEFYTYDGAVALRDRLRAFTGGRLVVHVAEMPIKCPVAPMEFAFLADDYFRKLGIRPNTEILYVTSLSGAFTKPVASARLGGMLDERNIALETDFVTERVDAETKQLVSYDGREIAFDLLVTVPPNMGAEFVEKSGLGDELRHVRVDPGTFQTEEHPNVFAIGDAANLPTSKAGSVAHFAADVFVDNFLDHVAGRPMRKRFDGHANCFVEAGDGKALLIDFNYDVEPLPGRFPWARIGPLKLLEESRINHLGKLAFKPLYWKVLLPGRRLPVSSAMSLAGKVQPEISTTNQLDQEVTM